MNEIDKDKDIFEEITLLIEKARHKVASTINEEMIILYWNIGKTVKEDIIKSDRAEYGKQIVPSL
ncbi:MAG: DUF1016 domain-containing protein, partial [bacterium]|nr:DUF1016 domain-containing protein [bacterium]